MSRLFLAFTFAVWLIAPPAVAQTEEQELGQMRLYVQQLEERVRQLTGENERLLYQLNQMRIALGQPPLQAGGLPAPGAIDTLPGAAGQPNVATVQQDQDLAPGASSQELGSISAVRTTSSSRHRDQRQARRSISLPWQAGWQASL